MTTLHLDLETFSEVPIKHGTHAYAEQAEVMLVALAVDDDPVQVWDLTDGQDVKSRLCALQGMIDVVDEVVIHNSHFDRTVLRHQGVTIPTSKITDTMVLALQHSLPAALGMLCDVLGVPQDKAKDKAGKKLIQLFCKPLGRNRKIRRATRDSHPDEWRAFIEYARLDVDAMRDVYGRLPRWNDSLRERELWLLDQDANDRGVAVDLDLARSALRAFERTSRSLAARASVLTDGAVGSLTQRAKLLSHLSEAHGFETADLTKGTINTSLKGDLDPAVRELLEIRQQAAATSPAKYGVLLSGTSSDGRLRGLVQFCGAGRTGRDAGRLWQPQNLPRPSLPGDVIELGIEAMKLDCEDLIFNNVSELCTSAVRGCLVPEDGCKFVVADLSNIEGRVAAWVAGEDWKLQAFRDFDRGTGHDLYALAYARSFNITPEEVIQNKKTGDGSMRQIGKVMELSLQYQGSVGAFVTMGANYGLEPAALAAIVKQQTSAAVWEAVRDNYTVRWSAGLEPEVWTGIKIIVDAWRRAHPQIVSTWYDLEDAAKSAIRNPDMAFEARGVRFTLVEHAGVPYLRALTHSGRSLLYCRPRIGKPCDLCLGSGKMPAPEDPDLEIECWECGGSGLEDTQIRYEGLNQYTRQWDQLETYGGKIFENLVQFLARDVFMGGFRRAVAASYPCVLRVHDELVAEVPDRPEFNAEALSALMTSGEVWTTGLPLAAAGGEMRRYAKGD